MKKFVAIALMFVSLCAIGCSGDKKPSTPAGGGAGAGTPTK